MKIETVTAPPMTEAPFETGLAALRTLAQRHQERASAPLKAVRANVADVLKEAESLRDRLRALDQQHGPRLRQLQDALTTVLLAPPPLLQSRLQQAAELVRQALALLVTVPREIQEDVLDRVAAWTDETENLPNSQQYVRRLVEMQRGAPGAVEDYLAHAEEHLKIVAQQAPDTPLGQRLPLRWDPAPEPPSHHAVTAFDAGGRHA